MWVVWDEHGEFLFRTGAEALAFVDQQINQRHWANQICLRQEKLWPTGS